MQSEKPCRVFVMGAYMPYGGTVMAYHLGRILHQEFGLPVVAVRADRETADHGMYAYDVPMPVVSIPQMEAQITADDILIVNPSFSKYLFGWRLPGFKISYMQGFASFGLLDCRFDHYVAVSEVVAAFLREVYAIAARVIPPFIHLDRLPARREWSERPDVVLPYRKGQWDVWDESFKHLREILAKRAPHIQLAEPLEVGIPQRELFSRIGNVRYLLTLSAVEGFGLVPLEAMALETVVVGYDGSGGRHYMRPGENCAVAPYARIEEVAELLIAAVDNPERSGTMARRGRETAERYTYEAFRAAWIEELQHALAARARRRH